MKEKARDETFRISIKGQENCRANHLLNRTVVKYHISPVTLFIFITFTAYFSFSSILFEKRKSPFTCLCVINVLSHA